jgi:hypothetical protein
MSVWYQFDVTVLSNDGSSHHFSYGEKNGSGFDEMIEKYTNDILLIALQVECTSGSCWLQKINKESGKEEVFLLSDYNDKEYEFSEALAQEYKLVYSDDTWYDWKKLINNSIIANNIMSNPDKYSKMKNVIDLSDEDMDFDNQILEQDYD